MSKQSIEIEARFLEINPAQLHKKILELGGKDYGEDFLKETIFYDKAFEWKDIFKFIRMRETKEGISLALKHFQYGKGKKLYASSKPVVKEVEIKVDDSNKAKLFLEEAGFVAFRVQEKKRHSYKMKEIILDVDTWPSTPPYLEVEGDSEQEIKKVAELLGFDWKKAVFRGAGWIIEQYLDVKVRNLKYLTFDKIE